MNTVRLVTRVGALFLLTAAVVLAVAAGSGLVEGSVLEAILTGDASGTAVVLAVLALVLAVLVGGGVWAYERMVVPYRPDDAETGDDDEADPEPTGFGDYESFEAFVEAGGLEREGLARPTEADHPEGDRDAWGGEFGGPGEGRSDLVTSGEERDEPSTFVLDPTAFEDPKDVAEFYEHWDGTLGVGGNGGSFRDANGNGDGEANGSRFR